MPSVPGAGEVLEAGRLQLLEGGVGQVRDLGVVAGQDHRVARKPGRAPVVVEEVEVGEQDRAALPSSTLARAASQEASASSNVSSSIDAPVSSTNCSSSRPTRPFVNREGDCPSIGT